MAANLARAGFEVDRLEPHAREGRGAGRRARERDGGRHAAAAAAARGRTVITMVPDAPEVEEVLLGDDGAADGPRPRAAWPSTCRTIAPTASRASPSGSAERGIAFLDAPVTGSRPEGRGRHADDHGRRRPEEAFERARPLFEAMGELVVHAGPTGHGSMVKLINNTARRGQRRRAGRGLIAGPRRQGWTSTATLAGRGARAPATRRCSTLKSGPDDRGRLRAAVQARAHAQGRAPLIAEAEALGVDVRAWPRPPRRLYAEADEEGLGDEDFAAVIEAMRAHEIPA